MGFIRLIFCFVFRWYDIKSKVFIYVFMYVCNGGNFWIKIVGYCFWFFCFVRVRDWDVVDMEYEIGFLCVWFLGL